MSRDTRLVWVVGLVAMMAMDGSAVADGFLKQVTHTGAFEMMGQKVAAKDDTTTMWIGADRAASINGDTMTIVCIPAENSVLMINHQKKQYSKASLNMDEMIDKAMADKGEKDADQAAQAKEMMKAMMGQSKASVEPTAETKKIDNWQAKKYLVTLSMGMMNMNMQLWATEDIAIDYKLYQELSNRMLKQMPGTESLTKEMSKIKGVVVLSTTELKMMGQPVTAETRLLEFSDKPAPAGVYAIPAGYTEVPIGAGQ